MSLSHAAASTTSPPLLLEERDGAVAVLTLNHSARRNVLSSALLAELLARLESIAADRGVRCLILAASGPVFSAGHDLAELVAADAEQLQSIFSLCTRVMETIRLAPQPVIAQVQGIATAAGCQLAATCDLIVASRAASFATPGVKIGMFCSTPAVALSRAVPAKKALEMLFTGMPISAAEAERSGLVNQVVEAERLETATRALAQRIANASGDTLARGKRAFYAQLALDRPAAYDVACQAMVAGAQTPDGQEGMRAFIEKRDPQWRE